MATSKTSICNIALSYLGGKPITETQFDSPDTEEARLCAVNFDACRDSVLEEHDWTFAIRRYTFSSPLSKDPVFGYNRAYPLPAEVIRVIEVNCNQCDWQVEGNNIVTDETKIDIKAVARVIDVTKFSPGFVHALAAYLATEIALPLTNSPSIQANMGSIYQAKMVWARSNDGRQGKSAVRTMVADGWKR